jgi:hypothetical protein
MLGNFLTGKMNIGFSRAILHAISWLPQFNDDTVPESMGKCHNRIANKLELTFEVGVIPVQPLCDVTFLLVVLVVWCEGAVGVATVKMAFPELCTQNINIYMYC